MFTIDVIDSGPYHGADATRTDLNITCNINRSSDSFGHKETISFTITDKNGTYLGQGDTIEEAFGNAASTLIREQFEEQKRKEYYAKSDRFIKKLDKALKKGK